MSCLPLPFSSTISAADRRFGLHLSPASTLQLPNFGLSASIHKTNIPQTPFPHHFGQFIPRKFHHYPQILLPPPPLKMASPSPSISFEAPIENYQEIFEGLKMRELKDQLCTLLLTFRDEKDPSREITAAHTFASIKPEDYPQHRRVVHSRHSDRDEFGKLLSTTDRLSQSSLASPKGRQHGSDMVEHRRILSSPPFVAISAHPTNSLVPFEKPSSAMSGQMMHHTNTSGSSTSPMASVGSLISVHEVSLTYTRSSFDEPFVDHFSPQIASKLPTKKGGELVTTFPASGSVHVHLGGPMDKGTKLPYTVSRPQADWAFQRAGEQVQISDQQQPKMRAPPMAQQQPLRMSAVGSNIHRPTGSNGGEGGEQKRRGEEAGTSMAADSPRRSPPPKMPAQPPPIHPSTGLPMLSHRQSRSLESSEQSSMLEQRGKGKSKTVFQKTICELRSEKSVTTFGRAGKSGSIPTERTINAPKSTAPKQIPVVQGKGLPRYKHAADQAMDAHLYTRYDDHPTKQRRIGGGEIVRLEEHSREEFTRIAKPPKTAPPPTIAPQPFGSPPQIRHEPGPVPSKFGGHEIQKPRLIDFATYKREVEELQRQAASINQSAVNKEEMPMPMSTVPLSPAIVLPKRPKEQVELPKAPMEPTMETTIKYFAREEFMEHRKREAKSEEMPSDEELKRVEEERQRREREEEIERRRIEEEQRIREERRRFNEAQKLREAEEEEARKRAAANEERRKKERPKQSQQLQMMKATTAEVYQTVEVISRIPSSTPSQSVDQTQISSRMAKLEEQIQIIPSAPMAMMEIAMPVEVAREQRTEEMIIERRKDEGKDEGKEEVEEEVQSKPVEPPVDYDVELDTSDMGKRLFEHLRRELQYEEEIDMEVRKRRRRKEGGVEGDEEEEEETERIVDSDESTVRRLPSTEEEMEEEVESEEVEMLPTAAEEPSFPIWREHLDSSGVLSPRHAPKVSMSGELPPLLEEEEEPSFEEKVEVVDTTTTSSTVQTRRKPPPPIPPPKPPHSTHFGVGPPSERSWVPSWSSAYSNVYPPTISPAYTMEYSPASSDYRSAISARPHYARPMRPLSPIQGTYGGGTHRVLKMVSETSSVSSRPISPYPSSTAALAIRDAREREKKEMSDLNDRLANYIEKVRFLEAQNRKLATDLDFLRNRWGRDAANVRDMFEGDLKQARKLIAESEAQRDELERKARAMAEEMAELRRKNDNARQAHDDDKERMEELLLKLAALESELLALKRRLAILEEDVKSLKRENGRLSAELQRAKTDLDQETLNRIDYQNQVQTLLEEVDFLRRAHDQEIQDLQAMASRDTTQENREMFRNELASAMRDIREDYERVNSRNRTDIESWYKLKVQEIQTQSARQSMEQGYAKEEVRRLRTQLGDLRGKLADLEGKNSLLEKQAEELAYQLEDDQRASESALNERDAQIRKMRDECQALMVELQMLLDTKQTLDAEIAIYRKMLEGEEDRAGLRQLVEQVVRTHQIRQADESESTRVLRGEKSSRQSYQRSAKGNVSILEVSPEGKYVVLENSHRSKEEPIGEWKLKRRIDGRQREIVYTFPRDFVLRPGKTVKVWAKNQGGIHFPPDELIFDGEDTFGVGTNLQTLLYNRDGEERASLIQRSSGAPASRQ